METSSPIITVASYAEYLHSRSNLAKVYRQYWLYPKLARHIRGRTLDIGCGIGDFLRFRPTTIGVDVNPLTVEYCRSLGFEARVMEPDVLPFEENSFDTVMLDNVLEHIADPAPLLAEIARILDASGQVVIGVPGKKGFAYDPDHKRFYDRPALIARLEQAGFEFVAIQYAPFHFSWFDANARQYCLYGTFRRGPAHSRAG